MVRFCEICDNLLTALYTNDELTFKCNICQLSYKSDESDTLIRERLKKTNVMTYNKILERAVDDPATPKAYVDCINKKCKSKVAKQVRIGESLILYNICVQCKTQWT